MSNEKQESLAVIIAEMRNLGNLDEILIDSLMGLGLRTYADRLEAAAKREKAAIEADALAAPPRNCDVGTAEEQFERWQAFCGRHDANCTGCPCDDGHTCTLAYCFAKWAQMPCEEGGAK